MKIQAILTWKQIKCENVKRRRNVILKHHYFAASSHDSTKILVVQN